MEFRGDRRGQSSLIGFILLFAILIIAFSSYQAVVVPSQNAEVEFTHSQQIENDFSLFRSNVVNAVESTDERSTSFTLGTQYPSRLMALNPPAPAGTLSTTEPGTVELGGQVNVNNVCGGGTSRSLVYEPQYNEYQGAQSTVYENTFVGTTFRDGQSFPQSQRLLRDGRVNLQLLTGDIAQSRTGSFGVEISASHRYTHDKNITSLAIPSQFDNETWENQILSGQENIQRIEDAGDGRVEITLKESREVSCAVVGVNGDPAFVPPEETATETVGSNASLFNTRWTNETPVEAAPGETGVNLTMQATDKKSGDPIENASVDFAIEGGRNIFVSEDPQSDFTNENGEQFLELNINEGANDGNQSQVYVTAGDDSDVVELQINETGGPDQPDSENIDVVPGSGQTFWGTEGVEFQIENTGEDSISIIDLTIENTSNAQVVEVFEDNGGSYGQGQHEVYIESSTDGVLEMDGTPYSDDNGTPLSIGSNESLTEPATLDAQTTATVNIYAFRNNGGQIVDASGGDVAITFGFSDGSSETKVIAIN